MLHNLKEILAGIKDNIKQHSASTKDEVSVMQGMINDCDYGVEIFNKDSSTGNFYYPAREFRSMMTDIVSNTTKITKDEASSLIEDYDFKRSHARVLVDMSKEFVNTYLDTGRKLKLGGRADSNVSLIKKNYSAGKRRYPSRVGVDENGHTVIEPKEIWVDSYAGIKASSPCPAWIRKER